MLKYMLDTNIVIYVLKRRPISVLDSFNKHQNQMCISAITLLMTSISQAMHAQMGSLLSPTMRESSRVCTG